MTYPRRRGLMWWIDRWRQSTAFTDLTLEEQGAYRNLLDECALRGGPIPNDERTLGKASGDALRWPAVRDVVLARFTLELDGWHHPTMDLVLRQSAGTAARQRKHRLSIVRS